MSEEKPNPLELLGVSLPLARRLQHKSDALLKITQTNFQQLSRVFHPDAASEPEHATSYAVISAAYQEVKDPERLQKALKDFLSGRSSAHLDLVYKVEALRGDKASLERSLRKAEAQITDLETQIESRRNLWPRITPEIPSSEMHHLNAAFHLVITNAKPVESGYQRFNLAWVDSALNVYSCEFRCKGNAERKLAREIIVVQQALRTFLAGTPIQSPYLISKGRLIGSTDRHIYDEDADGHRKAKALEPMAIAKMLERISPYLVKGNQLVTLRPIFSKHRPGGALYTFQTIGAIREIVSVLSPIPTPE